MALKYIQCQTVSNVTKCGKVEFNGIASFMLYVVETPEFGLNKHFVSVRNNFEVQLLSLFLPDSRSVLFTTASLHGALKSNTHSALVSGVTISVQFTLYS